MVLHLHQVVVQWDLVKGINQEVNIQERNLVLTQVEVINLSSQDILVEDHRLHSQVVYHLLQVVVQWDLDKGVNQVVNIQIRNLEVTRAELSNLNSQDILEKDRQHHSQAVHHLLQVVVQWDLDKEVNQVVNIQERNLVVIQVEVINLNSQGILVEDHRLHSQVVYHLHQVVVRGDLDRAINQVVNIQNRNPVITQVEVINLNSQGILEENHRFHSQVVPRLLQVEDLAREGNQEANIQDRYLGVTQVEVINPNSLGILVEDHRLHSQVVLHLHQVVVQWDLVKGVNQEVNIRNHNLEVTRVGTANLNSQGILVENQRLHYQVMLSIQHYYYFAFFLDFKPWMML